ncbi:ATP-binding protein [Bacillus sp. 03113]|uniref:ATP-binding protein n=1 Tax=Bacillus sp. 03113 TaxID=2578211 RepID=UPI001141AA57|nr:ATP-binding protein [Bacillus sp. 03113]
MNFTMSLLENLPFPYFHIDNRYNIISSSLDTNSSFLITEFIMEKASFETFLFQSTCHVPHEFHLSLDGINVLHLIYKVEDNNHYHLFCYPVQAANQNIKPNQFQSISFPPYLYEACSKKITRESREFSLNKDYEANIEKLAAGIAHEIRNPLTTIKGFLQLLAPTLKEVGKETYGEIALDEINRANEIISEFLNSSRPLKNKEEITQINQQINELTMLYESEAKLRNIKILTCLSKENLRVYIDQKQLKQVLVNMMRNAIEAIEGDPNRINGIIEISTYRRMNSTIICIKDNGCGISNEVVQKLFMPFYTTKKEGTGIGLSICKKIIQNHGGDISIQSKKGEGTKICIQLPLHADPQS